METDMTKIIDEYHKFVKEGQKREEELSGKEDHYHVETWSGWMRLFEMYKSEK